MAEGIADGMGGSCDFTIVKGYPSLYNQEDVSENVKNDAAEYIGKENVLAGELLMVSEGFAYYSQRADCCFYLLGTGTLGRMLRLRYIPPTSILTRRRLN